MIVVGIFPLIVPEEEVFMSYESVSQASYSSKLLSFFFLLYFCSFYFILTFCCGSLVDCFIILTPSRESLIMVNWDMES